jgi:uncharacterized protein (TIGR02001 family)
MRKLITAAGLAAIVSTLPTVASAQAAAPAATPEHSLTGNVALASEYRYRGIAQTNGKPAIQGGFDYGHASGIYLGTWASNVNWLSDQTPVAGPVSNSIEWDFYGGYKGTVGDFTYDLGVLYYWYPGKYPNGFTSPNTFEGYVAGGWKWFTLKYSYAFTNLFGFTESSGSQYVDLSGTVDVGAGFNLIGHLGYQYIPGYGTRSSGDCSYTDWKIGVTKEWLGLNWGLAYVDTDANRSCYTNAYGKNMGGATGVLTVSKTF